MAKAVTQRCSVQNMFLRHATLLKKRLWHRCFPVNFVKFLRTPFLQKTSGQLLLNKGFLASNNNVQTACVCIVFFFHYFKYYDQNIFLKNNSV